MAAVWELSRRTANAGYVDVAWSALMAAAALWYSALGEGTTLSRLLLALLAGLWGLRLALHLLKRVLSEPEDGRYRRLRAHWRGDQRKFFLFFQAQALLVALFSLPFLGAAQGRLETLWPLGVAAVLLWAIALGGEWLADRQLARFRADPANHGRVCRVGLWGLSRHPNYFFEWLHWFAYPLLAAGSPLAWLAWLGPLLMFVFLNWVTGIPFVEQQALAARGEAYRRYQREVSRFFPWFPRRVAEEER
ncbi:MAG: DUF1295 domain-containing protein [Xanthomonadales bacterium]|nr:DUF1295 domain-containing protein [Xanthomonadales bacterium]